MSSSKRRPGDRTFRPLPERLEGRNLLSKVVSGTDSDGDRWVLTLKGPGDLKVINQPSQPGSQGQAIQEIDVAGADPRATELVGKVTRGPQGDGRVFFQRFEEIGSPPAVTQNFNGNGLHAVDMPDFWLGYTSTEAAPVGTPGSGTAAAEMNIPNGVTTLRFGGVDTTFKPPGGRPLNQDNQNSVFRVNIGFPLTVGTSIIIDRAVSSGQAGTGQFGQPTQDSVVFSVAGRINLFQANAIEGNAQVPPGQFNNIDPTMATGPGVGGTYVISGSGTPPFIGTGSTTGPVLGQIGNIRVGGNATNFTALVFDNTGNNGAKVSNFSIGGETNDVLLSAPNGSRNLTFGRGLDKTEIRTQTIAHLFANRGALDSQVISTGQVGQLVLGGDVVGSRFLSGYAQDFAQITENIRGVTLAQAQQQGISPTVQLAAPPLPGSAQSAGALNQVLVAGDVTDSVFAASVQPFNQGTATEPMPVFGSPNSLTLPTGRIHAKVEGLISNETNPLVDPSAANRAFFASHLHLKRGPVIPPNVPEPPYPHPGAPPSGPRLARHLLPTAPTAPSRRAILPRHATRHRHTVTTTRSHPVPHRSTGQSGTGK